MQMVGEVRVVRCSPEETPFEETRIDLPIPHRSETPTKRICLIKRDYGSHHVNHRLRDESGNGGAPVVLKFICDVAKDRPQALALAREMLRPRCVRRCDGNAAECLPCIFGVAHPS
jgi:hypothetical protein